MTEELNTIQLNGATVAVDKSLLDFKIHQKPSSNVDYFGIDAIKNRLFVQFKGGSGSYIYNDIPVDVLEAAVNSESIGKFISSTIVGKFISDKHPERLIKAVLS